MEIGFDKKRITPSLPIPLGGFAEKRIANEIHDHLFLKVMVIRQGGIFYGIITLDLLAIDGLYLNQLASEFDKNGFDLNNFIISATHTHSGPVGTIDTSNPASPLYDKAELFGPPNFDYIHFLVVQTIECLCQACKNIRSHEIKRLKYQELRIGSNRNSETLPGDSQVICFEMISKEDKSLLINYACHPTVLNKDNLMLSADLPGEITKLLSTQYTNIIYLNGASGDISTRFNRKGNGFEELSRLGSVFVHNFEQQIFSSSALIKDHSIRISSHLVRLKTRKAKPLSEAEVALKQANENVQVALSKNADHKQLRLIQSLAEGALADYLYSKYYHSKHKEIMLPIKILHFCGQLFITIPGEIFSELTNPLKKDFDLGIIGYTNGYFMYIPNIAAFDNNWYEALSSPFEKGQGEYLIEQIRQILTTNNQKGEQ